MRKLISLLIIFAILFLSNCGNEKKENSTEEKNQPVEDTATVKNENRDTSGFYASVLIYGTVLDYYSEKGISEATVNVFDSGDKQVAMSTCDKEGKFKLDSLYTGFNYTIHFKKDGYIKKIMYLQTDNIVAEADSSIWPVDVTVTLFKHADTKKFSFLEQTPAAKLMYNPKSNLIEFDTAYAIGMRERIEKLLK